MFDHEIYKEMIAQGIVTKEQFDQAFAESNRVGQPISDVLINKKFLTEEDLLQFLSDKMNIPFFSQISENKIDPTLLAKLSFRFLKNFVTVPIIIDKEIFFLMAGPGSMSSIDSVLQQFPGPVKYAFAPKGLISDLINRYYPFDVGDKAISELEEDEDDFALEESRSQDLLEVVTDAPIVKLVNHLIFQAVKENASDIHIEPFEKELRVRYRVDGVMYQKSSLPKRYHGAIISRIKIISELDIAEKRVPQDGRIPLKVAEKAIDVRVSVLPCNDGERVTMRILDKNKGVVALKDLNFSKNNAAIIEKTIQRPNGIILVSGPTGSGKTTTLYSVLSELNQEDANIITVEDPVEYTVKGVSQVQVNIKSGLTFSKALRSILRQDPDIVLIGEIRDAETAKIATQAALTGHLVLSTIHTNDAPSTLTRLIEMGVEPYLVGSSVICVIAQRLVRALCQNCREQYNPNPDLLSRLGISQDLAKKMKFYKAVGCSECFKTGYKGRLALSEVMEVSDALQPLIINRSSSSEIAKKAIERGMTTLGADGIEKISNGQTTLEEVLSVAFIEGS